jgi:hypothetical protein
MAAPPVVATMGADAPSKKNGTGTCSNWERCCSRLALTRFAPFSYLWSCWNGSEFYYRRWYCDDSVVSIEFVYPKQSNTLISKIIDRMPQQLMINACGRQ